MEDCYQDRCENAPFASVGGLKARANLVRPKWILPEEEEAYLAGYCECARLQFGEDWATCSFGWRLVLTIGE